MTVPGVDHLVRYNDAGTFGVVSGTTSRSGLQIMALCLDPRFDLSHTYWIINGIAGVNPEVASIGSAAWAGHVVDGDIAYEIDSREVPASVALWNRADRIERTESNARPGSAHVGAQSDGLDDESGAGAVGLRSDQKCRIGGHARRRRNFAHSTRSYPLAQKPPFVFIGDSFCSCRYWHGQVMQKWATGIGTNFIPTARGNSR